MYAGEVKYTSKKRGIGTFDYTSTYNHHHKVQEYKL